MIELPGYADVVVVGGGTSGSVVAGLLAERSDRSVLVLEAGPDYGSFVDGGWPADLLDTRVIAPTHQWGYKSASRFGRPGLDLQRARVIGGCSSHNGMAAVWGHADDYDAWAKAGCNGWDTTSLLPLFAEANRRMRVFTPGRNEVGEFHETLLDASEAAGIPLIDDLNDLTGPNGMTIPPVNAPGAVRWNAALAYLDPVRDRSHVSIAGDVLVDRIVVERGRATGVVVVEGTDRRTVRAGEVVLSAGAYESPAVLMRSGIGEPEQLRAIGVAPLVDLPGVGANLHDHPAYDMEYAGTADLYDRLRAFDAAGPLREEGVIAKLRVVDDTAFDLHIYPVANPGFNGAEPYVAFPVATMTPRSRGSVRLASSDPTAMPILDHGYLTDEGDHDLAVLIEGIRIARRLATTAPLAAITGGEVLPGPGLQSNAELAAHIRENSTHYYHPVGTCRMGPAGDPMAVVGPDGRVHGVEGLRVADCSIIPVIPRANTNLPAVVIGEKIAAAMLGSN